MEYAIQIEDLEKFITTDSQLSIFVILGAEPDLNHLLKFRGHLI